MTTLLLIILLLWYPQTVMHEVFHALAARFFGASKIRIRPFPRWNGGFFPASFAEMSYMANTKMRFEHIGVISIMPQLVSSTIMILAFLAIIFLNITGIFELFIFALFISNFIDASFNLNSILFRRKFNGNDAWMAQKFFNISIFKSRVIVVLWNIYFTTMMLVLAFSVF